MTTNTLTIILVSLLTFLIGREVFCWYCKVNEIVAVLKRIEKELKPHRKSVS